ncbi:MAG: TauD/TfdA family dioxygenase [Planctomycetales bacterium]|nr:TauD/TfdA family dioxygenase [Planctomycetales bacterium]
MNTSIPIDVAETTLDTQQEQAGSLFPFVLACQSSHATIAETVVWVAANKQDLLRQATASGAVILRGFPVHTAEDFDALISALDVPNFPYKESLSNAVRVNRTNRVFTANEAPANVDILFHHEMAQTPLYPQWIMFFCEQAAEQGGATQLCRSDWLYRQLKSECPAFIQDCEQKGLQYSNVMPDQDDAQSGMGRSWRSTLGVDSRDAAERRLADLNYSHQWLEGGCLRVTTPPLPAVMEVAPGRKTFFNQLIAAYGGWKDERNDPADAIRHGDGSRLDADAVRQAIDISEQLSFEAHWQSTDVALLDNTVAMHGRRPFVGTRKVLASLASMQTHAF